MDPKQFFEVTLRDASIGQFVRCRDTVDAEWEIGQVTRRTPLMVQLQRWGIASTSFLFRYVAPVEPGDIIQTTMRTNWEYCKPNLYCCEAHKRLIYDYDDNWLKDLVQVLR